MKKRGVIIVSILILIVLIMAIFFTFFYTPTCSDVSCWKSKVTDCNSARYLNNAEGVLWEYKIKGKSKENCIIEVTAISVTEGSIESKKIEGYSMVCTQPSGASIYPETTPNFCHGRLKEELQELIINQLHKYILENLGEIAEEFESLENI